MIIAEHQVRILHTSWDDDANLPVTIPLQARCQETVPDGPQADGPEATTFEVVEAKVELTGEDYPIELITQDELYQALIAPENPLAVDEDDGPPGVA